MIGKPSTRARFAAIVMVGLTTWPATGWAQGGATPYPTMAPVEQYRMTRTDEIALAKSAAPASISNDAEVLVLGAAGYETAVPGKNGFVCLVQRSWASPFGDKDFWNPTNRAPQCNNAAAAHSVLPAYFTRTRWALAGLSESAMEERSQSDPAASSIMTPDIGAMCYMLSKGESPSWHPHLMFFMPHAPSAAWGANREHSPVFKFDDTPTSVMSVFLIPVVRYSDGSQDSHPD